MEGGREREYVLYHVHFDQDKFEKVLPVVCHSLLKTVPVLLTINV